jgi:hypothetical protein
MFSMAENGVYRLTLAISREGRKGKKIAQVSLSAAAFY